MQIIKNTQKKKRRMLVDACFRTLTEKRNKGQIQRAEVAEELPEASTLTQYGQTVCIPKAGAGAFLNLFFNWRKIA